MPDMLTGIPDVHVSDINCDKVFDNDNVELEKAKLQQLYSTGQLIPDKNFTRMAHNCTSYRKRYITKTLSKEERDFPIAFSILIFKDMEQVEKLLRAIYTPHNYYCVHVDSKSPHVFLEAMKTIANCFDNVFLTDTSYDVQWGQFR